MPNTDAYLLAPYRVEWRPDCITNWVYIRPAMTHDEAREKMRQAKAQYRGQVRIVAQHVICAEGLGA